MPAEKVKIIREHLLEAHPLSEVGEKYGIAPTQFYQSIEDAIRIVTEFVEHYNNRRLHSATGYITPADKLTGRAESILAAREAKLAAAGDARKATRKVS